MSSTLSRPGPPEPEIIVIGCDHAGYHLKAEIFQLLREMGYQVEDVGCHRPDVSVHYPLYGKKVVEVVLSRPRARGVLICGTGLGMSVIANRFPGIRAALCHDVYTAEMSRRHNDANVLTLGARYIEPEKALEILDVWLKTPFEGGRHQRRVDKISKLGDY